MRLLQCLQLLRSLAAIGVVGIGFLGGCISADKAKQSGASGGDGVNPSNRYSQSESFWSQNTTPLGNNESEIQSKQKHSDSQNQNINYFEIERKNKPTDAGWVFNYRVGELLSERFEQFVKLRKDPESTIYLRKLTERLIAESSHIKMQPLGVNLVEKGLEFPISIPGNRVYIPYYLLSGIKSESELVALIAIEVAKIDHRAFLFNLERDFYKAEEPRNIRKKLRDCSFQQILNWNNPPSGKQIQLQVEENEEGIYASFPEILKSKIINEAYLENSAVELLYRAGFDSRGFEIYDRVPYREFLSEQMRFNLKKKLKLVPPIRNYLNTSDAFLTFKERVLKLRK